MSKGRGASITPNNNGKPASDPKLVCTNFVNALERIPKVIESHEKEVAKAKADIGVYTAIAGGSWKKEDELRSLKTQAAELDRKIALELAPPMPEKEEVNEGEKQEHGQGGRTKHDLSRGKARASSHFALKHDNASNSYARSKERARRPRHHESCGHL